MKNSVCKRLAWLAALSLAAGSVAYAQEILLDKMERAGDLVCFQSFDDAKIYYYLPDRPRVAESDGRPQFSFMKFVTNAETGGEGGITGAEGGGIVHFLVEFNVPAADVRRAEQELARRIPGARIAGPIIYRSGTFSLVSTILDEKGEYASRVLGLGKAPILEGHKAAVSILLNREGATLLWENFKMDAPDISLQFEMTVAGYREPFEAEVEGDWSLIASNKTIAAGLKTTWLGVDIQNTLKELQQENAIRVVQKGTDESAEKVMNLAYGKLVEYIFEQVNNTAVQQTLATDQNIFSNVDKAGAFIAAERAAAGQAGGPVMGVSRPPATYGAAQRHAQSQGKTTTSTATTGTTAQKTQTTGSQTAGATGTAAAKKNPYDLSRNKQNPPSFALLASYRMKRFNSSGTFRLNFNKFSRDNLVFPISENVGDIYSRFGDDPGIFREVNLDDPVYKQRELVIFLDGQDIDDFAKFVNFVTVTMRKEHGNGDVTVDELRVDRNNFQNTGNNFRLLYGWKGDDDRDDWLRFQYKTHWSFQGGAEAESPWIDSNQFSINLVPPNVYRTVSLEADPDTLGDADVRLVTVNFFYDLFGQEQQQTVSMRVNKEELNKTIEYTHAPNNLDYEYEIVWRLRGGKQVSSGRLKGSDEYIFCDELPQS
jgi:hypothetical protein